MFSCLIKDHYLLKKHLWFQFPRTEVKTTIMKWPGWKRNDTEDSFDWNIKWEIVICNIPTDSFSKDIHSLRLKYQYVQTWYIQWVESTVEATDDTAA